MLRRTVSSFLVMSLFVASASAGRFAAPPPPAAADLVPVPDEMRPPPPPDAPAPVVTRDAVEQALATRRARSIAAFRAYWKGGIYPHNTITSGKLNIWLDAEGHYCAAATIIMESGLATEVMNQASTDNFIRLVDVKDGWLMDWMLTSGLTQEELVAIQAPFVGGDNGRMLPVMPEPAKPDPMRLAVDARLRKGYVRTDRMLAKNGKKDLQIAVDRLMAHPDLAQKMLAAELGNFVDGAVD